MPSLSSPTAIAVNARVLLSVAGLLASLLVFCPGSVKSAPPAFQQFESRIKAPATIFQDLSGRARSFADFRGKVLVVNLWATWCGPCVKEMPSLERLYARLPKDKYEVIPISQDKGGAAVAGAFLQRINVSTLPIFFDPSSRVARDFGARGFPTTIILDPDGVAIARLEGPAAWDSDDIVAYLLSLSQ